MIIHDHAPPCNAPLMEQHSPFAPALSPFLSPIDRCPLSPILPFSLRRKRSSGSLVFSPGNCSSGAISCTLVEGMIRCVPTPCFGSASTPFAPFVPLLVPCCFPVLDPPHLVRDAVAEEARSCRLIHGQPAAECVFVRTDCVRRPWTSFTFGS